MPFDPEDVLGAVGADPGKGQKPSSGFDPLDVKAAAGSTGNRNLIAGTIDPNTQFTDFRFQPKTNADNYLLRAQDQGFWESLGKTIGNTAANIPLDIVQGVGYLGTLLEFGDDRDYTNALVEGIEKLKNPAGEVYREHPDQTFDITDSAWWLNNLGGLIESAASFAVEGAGIAKIFGNVAKAAAWSTRAAKLGAKAAQGLSAATLTYMEGAMSGANVFETAYNNNYSKFIHQGMDAAQADEQAKHIASQAAAATVQIHTAMNLGLNLTALTPLFRDPDQAIVRWWRQNGALQNGEDAAQWGARIAAAVPEGMPLKKLLGLGMEGPTRLGLETLQEGLEEVNTQYAEHIGKAIGEGKEEKNVGRSLADAGRYFDEVLNQEGALNMALGSLGGLAQTVILDHIPVHNVIKYGTDGKPLLTDGGQPQTERISSHTLNERMNRQYFDNIKDALTKDMGWFAQKNQELETALKNKDLATLARTRADLMSVHNLRAISLGLADVWKNQYRNIMALDNTKSLSEDLNPAIAELDKQIEEDRGAGDMEALNQKQLQRYELMKRQAEMQDVTEAMQKGFADSKSDNSYQQRAQQAIQNLDYLTKLYQDMQDKFTGTPELDQSGLSEHMFYRQANLYLHKQQLDMMDQDLLKLRSRIDEMTLSKQDDMLVRQAQEFLANKEVWDTTVKKLNNDISRLNEATSKNNEKVLLQLLDKYKIPATKDAGKNLIETLERRKKELQDRADYTNKELNDTIAVWQQTNPDKKIKDVLQRASERPALEDIYRQNRAYYEQGMTEYETAREQLARDSTNEGINRFLKENKPESNKKQLDKQHIEAYNQQLDREIAATLDAKQKQAQVGKIDQRIAELQRFIQDRQNKINTLTRQNSALRGFRNLLKQKSNRSEIAGHNAEIHEFEFELSHLRDRRSAMMVQANQATVQSQNVARTPAPVIQPVTQVTPASTPAENTTQQQDEQVSEEQIPAFDFGSEIIPAFTTLQEGEAVFDRIVGGNEAGTNFRQFVQFKKDSDIPFLVSALKIMLQKTNQQIPTEEEFSSFVIPYITALRNNYQTQKPDATQNYENLKSVLKPAVLPVLDILEGEFRQHGFSYDRAIQVLNQQIKEGNLAKTMVGMVANRLKDYLEVTEQPLNKEPENVQPAQEATIEQETSTTEFNEQPGTYISPVTDSEPTTFSNAALDLEIVQQEQKRFVGASNIEGVRASFNTNPYKEFDNGTQIRIVADHTQLDPSVNTDVLLPGVIVPGDNVTLQIDENWSGEINYDTEMVQDEFGEQLRRADMFQNYLDATGKIDMSSSARHPRGGHANVPIKIIHEKTGKVIGYLPRAEWILAKYPDTQNYRNIVDEYQDEDTTVTENVARQYQRIIKLREAVVRAWNTDKSLQLKTVVSKRGTGHVMLNREVNPNTGRTKLVNRSAKNMLPDTSLEIAIMKQGVPYVGSGIATEKQTGKMASFMKDATSLPVVMLPSPDGTFVPTPLYTHRLGDNPGSLNTVIAAIEMYLQAAAGNPNTKNIDKIRETTGFDIQSPEGLRNFIQQYFTYTQKFGEKDTVITPSEAQGGATPQFMLDIPDLQPGERASFIKVGTTFSGEKPIYAQLVNGQLHPDFETALREGLADRFKNVVFAGKQLRGINSTGEFKAPTILKDGTVRIHTYENYNEFVKANSVTYIYGLNKVGDQYVYMANPVIQLDYDQALKSAPPVPSASLSQPSQLSQTKSGESTEEYDDLADLFGNGMLSPGPSSVTPMVIPTEGEQVSLELLQNLRNLTPEAHRNTKSPESVLRELLERGVTVLADGHNPFYIC